MLTERVRTALGRPTRRAAFPAFAELMPCVGFTRPMAVRTIPEHVMGIFPFDCLERHREAEVPAVLSRLIAQVAWIDHPCPIQTQARAVAARDAKSDAGAGDPLSRGLSTAGSMRMTCRIRRTPGPHAQARPGERGARVRRIDLERAAVALVAHERAESAAWGNATAACTASARPRSIRRCRVSVVSHGWPYLVGGDSQVAEYRIRITEKQYVIKNISRDVRDMTNAGARRGPPL